MDNMQLWLSSSTDSINLNDSAEGFYLNPDLEGLTGLPEIRSVNGLNAGYDGGWTATQLWAARLITIRGVIALNDKAAVETRRKALAKLMAQGKNESLQLKFVSESGNVYTTSVRTTYCTMALKRVFWRQEYQIQLRADDPLIYDDGGAELVAILRVMAGVNGFEIPFEIPFAIGDSADPTDVNVGDEATYPLITLKGDLHSPTIVNLTTNQQMQVLADIITTTEWHDYTTTYTTNGFAQIGDGIDGAPLSLTHLYGNATQKTLSGKNLFSGDFSQFDNQGGEGTTYAYFKLPTDGDYALSFKAKNDVPIQNDVSIGFSRHGGNASDGYKWVYQSKSISMTKGEIRAMNNTYSGGKLGFIFMYPKTANALKFLTDNFEIQLEASSTATDYEKFVGGIPSPNPDYPQDVKTVSGLQTVKITGRNLLDISDGSYTSNGITTVMSNDTATISGTISSSWANLMAIKNDNFEAGTYTFSTNSASAFRKTFRTWDADGNLYDNSIQPNTTSATFTLPTNMTRYMVFISAKQGDTLSESFTLQLERSSTASDFEPYQEQSQVINLGTLELLKIPNTNYTDGFRIIDGTWYIHKEVGKVVLDGTNTDITWSRTAVDGDYAFWFRSITIGALQEKHTKLCDKFTYTITAYNQGAPTPSLCENDATTTASFMFIFKVPSSLATTITEWTTWLSTHNTTVYYAIATPTTTEITDSELIAQLNHIYSLYGGQNNLWLIPSAGAQGEMEVSYATDKDVDYHEVVIDCQARTVTQDGQNLYPALAPGSEFIQLVPGQNRLYLTSTVSSDDGTAEVKFKKGNISI